MTKEEAIKIYREWLEDGEAFVPAKVIEARKLISEPERKEIVKEVTGE